jgi:hypothetical protein
MEAMGTSRIDERIGDLSRRVDEGFRRVDAGFQRIDADLRAMRLETKTELVSQRAETNARFEAMQRLILQVGGGIVATLAVGFLGGIAMLL